MGSFTPSSLIFPINSVSHIQPGFMQRHAHASLLFYARFIRDIALLHLAGINEIGHSRILVPATCFAETAKLHLTPNYKSHRKRVIKNLNRTQQKKRKPQTLARKCCSPWKSHCATARRARGVTVSSRPRVPSQRAQRCSRRRRRPRACPQCWATPGGACASWVAARACRAPSAACMPAQSRCSLAAYAAS